MNAHTARSSGPTVLVVASGRGGTGVSLVAALLGLAVAGDGWRVLLVDGAEGRSALHLMLGVQPRQTPPALQDDQAMVDELLLAVSDTLALLPGVGAALAEAAPLAVGERQRLLERVAERYDRYDLVVVDAGSRLEAVLTACAGGATRLLLVATGDQITMAATHALLKAVETHRPGLPVEVVVNRAVERDAVAVHDHLATAAERFLARPVGYAGAIPNDPCLQGGLGAGMTVQDAAAGSPAALAARAAGLQMLTDRTEPAAGDRAESRLLARNV